MNNVIVEGLKWALPSVAALAGIALFSMNSPDDNMYTNPYPTDPSFLELREPRVGSTSMNSSNQDGFANQPQPSGSAVRERRAPRDSHAPQDPPARRRWRQPEPVTRVRYVETHEQPTNWAAERANFQAQMLHQHRLKVHDYAFESKLPPVPKAVIKRKEKRSRAEFEAADQPVAGPSSQPAPAPAPVPSLAPPPIPSPAPSSNSASAPSPLSAPAPAPATDDTRPPKRRRVQRKSTEPIPASSETAASSSSRRSGSKKSQGKSAAPRKPRKTPSARTAFPTPPATPSASRDAAAMDVDAPAPCHALSTHTLAWCRGALAAQLERSLSQCSSLTSLGSLGSCAHAPPLARRGSLCDISASYNASPAPSAAGTAPTKRQAGATRKTRSSAAKRAAGSPKPTEVRRSARTKVQAVRR